VVADVTWRLNGKRAHQAMEAASDNVAAVRQWMVDKILRSA
jgi:hypothetical protein